jgi:16S rRNA (guanine1516-N2)-methyltransferase
MFTMTVSTTKSEFTEQAQQLAARLHLPFETHFESYDYVLLLTPKHLELKKNHEKINPLYVDFLDGKITYRRQHTSLRNEALARAMGLKHHLKPFIVDATAGLGRDSFILASLGFEVQLFERSPIAHALLEDGMRRAAENPHVAPIIERMHLTSMDAIQWMQTTDQKPDIIYLDPMFPEKQKTALVKKEMRIFQDIIGEDSDTELLLKSALSCATKRVVVKRPRLADPIQGPEPSFNLKGSSSRFDIYLREAHGNITSDT